jgi:uncharacterized protein (TIGR02145 family)
VIVAVGNTPPHATFTVDPTTGSKSTYFNVDGSGSWDDEDPASALRVRWDWDNDGTYDTGWRSWKTESHQYSSSGFKTIKMEVKDTGDLTDTHTEMVIVESDTPCESVTDFDGNTYQVVQIGGKCWMAENLKVTHYRNGDAIPNVTDDTEWINLTTGAYCNYDNNAGNVSTYGRLYNWYAVDDSRKIAPAGWHVPTDGEWKQLEMCLGMSQSEADDTGWRGTNEGSKLAGNASLWASGDLENDPEFGTSNFTALPGGYRYSHSGYFGYQGYTASFWSSTEHTSSYAWYRGLDYSSSDVGRYSGVKHYGFSVRCVRDN